MEQYIDVVLDGPPSTEAGRFVEVENEQGRSINAGTWIECPKEGTWRLRLKMKPGLNNLSDMIHTTADNHGFWPAEGRNMGEMLMLAVSELAEALEEHRDGKPAVYYKYTTTASQTIPEGVRPILSRLRDNVEAQGIGSEPIHEITREDTRALVAAGIAKPEGVAVELADCLIRVLDTLSILGVDIDQVVADKMAYNNSRPHKHGRAY